MRNTGFKFTLTGRLKEPKKFEVPGPGTYETPNMDAYLERMPVFTLSPRTHLPKDDNQKPSPNTYYPEKVLTFLTFINIFLIYFLFYFIYLIFPIIPYHYFFAVSSVC